MLLLVWKQLFQATWNGLNRKIEQISDSLAQQKVFIESIVSLSQFKEIRDLRLEFQHQSRQLKSDRTRFQAEFNRLREEERDKRHIRVQQWLGAVNSDTRHTDVLKLRHPRTGEWLLSNVRFRNWYNLYHCLDPLLWLNGIPGAGMYALILFVS
jgi:hypothetical protein